jgi:hypothetical protein
MVNTVEQKKPDIQPMMLKELNTPGRLKICELVLRLSARDPLVMK